MNKVKIRFFDPVIYAFNTIVIHWRKLLLSILFFGIPQFCLLWIGTPPIIDSPLPVPVPRISDYPEALILAWLLYFWIEVAYKKIFLCIYDKKDFGFNDILSSIRYIPRYMGLVIMLGLVIFGLMRVEHSLGIFLTILAVLLMVWLVVKVFLFAMFFVVDKNYTIQQSLVANYHLTKNQFMILFGVSLLIACLVGMRMFVFTMIKDITVSALLESFGLILWSLIFNLVGGYIYRKLLESRKSINIQP